MDKNGQGKKTGQRDGLENRQGDGQNLDKKSGQERYKCGRKD